MRSLLLSISIPLLAVAIAYSQHPQPTVRLDTTKIERTTIEPLTFNPDQQKFPLLSSKPTTLVSVGYGYLDHKKVTGSVSSLNSIAVQGTYYSNLAEYIQGRIPGVTITGGPGNYSINIRGQSSFYMSNEPLIMVNGVETSVHTALNLISPNDVVSVNVIKDGTAAIYGMRGANGVILIQTK